jgi:hypothetical protein
LAEAFQRLAVVVSRVRALDKGIHRLSHLVRAVGQGDWQVEGRRQIARFRFAGSRGQCVDIDGNANDIVFQRRLLRRQRVRHVDGQAQGRRVTICIFAKRQKQVGFGDKDGQRMDVDAGQVAGALVHQLFTL